MDISLFEYDLPEEKIAQYPAEERDASRMMVLDRANGTISHRQFRDLPEFLGPSDVVVINETSVIRARLLGKKAGSDIEAEVMLLREVKKNLWECLVRPGRRLPVGSRVIFDHGTECELVSRTEFGGRIARFELEGNVLDLLAEIGHVPLPAMRTFGPRYGRNSPTSFARSYWTSPSSRESGGVLFCPAAVATCPASLPVSMSEVI